MALNATAALAMAAELDLDVDTVIASWGSFGGVHRRFESHGVGGGVRIFDDYAHHPTEIAASLEAAKAAAAPGRLIAVFQPGTYSRTQTFAREFADAMALADIAVVMDIFPAREEPIPGVTGATISDLIPLPPERVIYEPRYAAVPDVIAERRAQRRSGDHDGDRQRLPALRRHPRGVRATRASGGDRMTATLRRARRGRRRRAAAVGHPAPQADPRRRSRRCWLPRSGSGWSRSVRCSACARSTCAGAHEVTAEQVRAVAEIADGTPLVRLDTDAIRTRVEALPDVASAQVTTSFPSTVTITVTERVAVGVVAVVAGGFMLVDRTGDQFRHVDARPKHLPLFVVPNGTDARTTGGAVATVAVGAAGAGARADQFDPGARPERDHAADAQRPGRAVGQRRRAARTRRASCRRCCSSTGSQIDVTDPDQPFLRP